MDYKEVYAEIKRVVNCYYAGDEDEDLLNADEYMEKIGAIVDVADEHKGEVEAMEKLGLERFVEFLNENNAGVRIKVELVDEFLGQ